MNRRLAPGDYELLYRPAPEATDGEPWYGRSDYNCRSRDGLGDLLQLAIGEQGLGPGALLRAARPRGGEAGLWVVGRDGAPLRAPASDGPIREWVRGWEGQRANAYSMLSSIDGRRVPGGAVVLAACRCVRARWAGAGLAMPDRAERALSAAEARVRGDGTDDAVVRATANRRVGMSELSDWTLAAFMAADAVVEALGPLALRDPTGDAGQALLWLSSGGASAKDKLALQRLAPVVRRELPLGMVLLSMAGAR